MKDPEGRSRGARSRGPWEAAAVLIRVWIEGTQPLAGTAATKGSEPLRFDGWLELLRVVSELVAAAPWDGEDADTAEEPMQGNQKEDGSRHPELPAHE
jgi:hypothetical protein